MEQLCCQVDSTHPQLENQNCPKKTIPRTVCTDRCQHKAALARRYQKRKMKKNSLDFGPTTTMAASALLQSSAAGYLALLEDPEDQLREYALNSLLSLVDKFWPEISEQITKMYDHIRFMLSLSSADGCSVRSCMRTRISKLAIALPFWLPRYSTT